jgi:hypothetical protein
MDLIILSPILGGIIRNLSGWIEGALKDGKISSYEWGQLLATTIQVAVIGYSAVMLGADPLVGAGAGILGSMAISTVKKVGSSEVKV